MSSLNNVAIHSFNYIILLRCTRTRWLLKDSLSKKYSLALSLPKVKIGNRKIYHRKEKKIVNFKSFFINKIHIFLDQADISNQLLNKLNQDHKYHIELKHVHRTIRKYRLNMFSQLFYSNSRILISVKIETIFLKIRMTQMSEVIVDFQRKLRVFNHKSK